MNATQKAAVLRGILTGIGMFVVTFAGARLMEFAVEPAIYMGIIAAGGVFGIRSGVEGAYDSHRAKVGDVKPADVGSQMNLRDPDTWGDTSPRRSG